MENKLVEVVNNNFSYLGYIAVGVIFFFKSFKSSYEFIKEIFSKKTSETDKGTGGAAGTTSDISINIGTGTEKVSETSDPVSEANKKELRYYLSEQNNVLDLIFRVKGEIIENQMNFFDSRMLTLKIQADEIMSELLKEADIDFISPNNYFADFENFLEILGRRIKKAFKRMCLINGFDKQNSAEFRETIKRNIAQIDAIIVELLRKRYPQKHFLKNFNKFDALKPTLHAILEDCFNNAKDIAERKKGRAESIKKEFEEQISDVLKKPYSVDY